MNWLRNAVQSGLAIVSSATRLPHLALALCLSAVAGCATWEVPSEETSLPTPSAPPDSVLLEIEFVKLPTEWEGRDGELWAVADEQHFGLETRRRLAANGIRCGILKAQLPPIVHELLATEKPAMQQIAEGADPEESQVFANFRELRSRAGRPYKIVAAPRRQERMVLLVNDAERVRALQFSGAQGMFSLRTEPIGDGRVRLELTPLIEHGEVRQRIVPGQASFLLDAGRDNDELELLRIEAVISPGETLMLAATPECRGIGGWYFGGDHEASNRSLMLIRLSQTQFDALFSDKPLHRPLTTSLE